MKLNVECWVSIPSFHGSTGESSIESFYEKIGCPDQVGA
jgi:hypothetical protein